MHRSLAVLFACALGLLTPVATQAATRYASPTGTGPEPCTQADPCALTTATSGGLANGDIVILLGRTTGASTSLYDLTPLPGRAGLEINRADVTLTALEEGVTIRSNSTSAAVRAPNGGAAIRRLVIQNVCRSSIDPDPAGCPVGTIGYALSAASATVDRVFAYSSKLRGCDFNGAMVVSNTVCFALDGGYAIKVERPSSATLVNVTARSKFYPAVDITNAGAGCVAGGITIVNTIVNATATFAAPLWANRDGIADPCALDLTLRSSSIPTRDVGMSVILAETGMLTEAPSYSDGLLLRPRASSPTVNRGSTNAGDLALAGAFDLDGQDRVQGGRIDIGAYEYGEGVVPPAPPVIPGDPGAGGGGAGGGGGAAGGGGTAAGPVMSVNRTRAVVRPRVLNVRGRVTTTRAGVATRTVARVQGKRRIPICRVRRVLQAGTADLRCTPRPAVRALLRKRALTLVVTTRFVPTGTRQAIVDRQNLRIRKR